MTERLEFRYSPKQQLGLMVVGCVVAGAALLLALRTSDVVHRWVGWLGVGLMLLCVAVAVKRFITGGVPFVFDRSGIAFPGGDFGLLPWSEVKSYSVVTLRGNPFLALTFHNPARVLSRVSPAKRNWALANERLGLGHWSLTFIGLTPGLDEAIAFIAEHALVPPAR